MKKKKHDSSVGFYNITTMSSCVYVYKDTDVGKVQLVVKTCDVDGEVWATACAEVKGKPFSFKAEPYRTAKEQHIMRHKCIDTIGEVFPLFPKRKVIFAKGSALVDVSLF